MDGGTSRFSTGGNNNETVLQISVGLKEALYNRRTQWRLLGSFSGVSANGVVPSWGLALAHAIQLV